MANYWHIDFLCADPAEQSWLLFEHGALGVEELAADRIRASFCGSKEDVEKFVDVAKVTGFSFLESSPVEEENWVANCESVFEPVIVGELRIKPISTADERPAEAPASDLYLIPGQGFGTGHHKSTQQALALLQSGPVRNLHPQRVLDFGCGSGVLAIACAKLYNSMTLAIDISKDALDNAFENAALNSCATNVQFQLAPALRLGKDFDLVCANIYAEVLIENEEQLHEALKVGGQIILAGILSDLAANVVEKFGERFKLIEKVEDAEWHAFLFSK